LTAKNTENNEDKHRKLQNHGGFGLLKRQPRFSGSRLCFSLLFSVLLPAKAFSQSPEARIDGIAANPAAVQGGAGIIFSPGTYLRSGIEGGIGASENGLSGRFDIVNRFHLDPFREHKWAPYGGGGITTRFDKDRRTRIYLLLIAGVDGPARHGLSTSIEAGLGGGARLGVILRKTKAERR
jgi:hypothetical protein